MHTSNHNKGTRVGTGVQILGPICLPGQRAVHETPRQQDRQSVLASTTSGDCARFATMSTEKYWNSWWSSYLAWTSVTPSSPASPRRHIVATPTCTECRRPTRARSWPPVQHHNSSERYTGSVWLPVKHRITFKLATLMHQKLFIVAVHRTWLTSSRSAQPTLIGSSAPLRQEQPRYRELGPSSEDGLSLSVVPTCGTVFLRLSALSTPTRPSIVLSKLISSSLRLTINCFYFLFYHFFQYVMHGLPDLI